jgi:uncharacterized membrane protein YwaF
MKLHGQITINGRIYAKGTEVPWFKIYPFFMLHMLVFGSTGFAMAYFEAKPNLPFLYMHGGFAILIYTVLYVAIFGFDEVKWMFINAALGVTGLFTQMAWIMARFGKHIDGMPWYVHVIPFVYYVLYVFLIRHAFLDFFDARENPARRALVEKIYVAVSLAICGVFYLLPRASGA